MKTKHVFRAYDIRGIVDDDFSLEWVLRLGKACGTYFLSHNINSVVVGYDCRLSSVDYNDVLIQGLLSTGVDVISIGMVPTPIVYFAIKFLNRKGGIMITASHNPSQYNGFKIWAGASTIYGKEIQVIQSIFESGHFLGGTGIASRYDSIPAYMDAVLDRCKLSRSISVVVDGGNGSGGEVCSDLLEAMGVEVTRLYCDPDGRFPHHHPDPVVEENMQELKVQVKIKHADFGVGLDGDADRIGIIDPNGRLLSGDELLAIYAQELLTRIPGATIIADVKCSGRLFDDIKHHGGFPMMWTTGHSIIKARMQEVKAELAGEMSGHMFFSDGWFGFDDAIYATCRLVALFSAQKKPMSELPGWPTSFITGEVNIPCEDDIKFEVVEKVKEYFRKKYDVIEIDGARILFPHGWGLVRVSNTQPVLVTRFEADSEKNLMEIRRAIEEPLKEWIREAQLKSNKNGS